MMKSRGTIECDFCHGIINTDDYIHDEEIGLDICKDKRCLRRYKDCVEERFTTNVDFQRTCLNSLLFDWAFINGVFYLKELESMGMKRYSVKEATHLLCDKYIRNRIKGETN